MRDADPLDMVICDEYPLRRAAVSALLAPWAQENALDVRTATFQAAVGLLDRARLFVLSCGGSAVRDDLAEVMRAVVAHPAAVPIAVLSDRSAVTDVADAFRLGARGYLTTQMEPALAYKVLSLIMRGGTYYPPEVLFANTPFPGPEEMSRGPEFSLVASSDSGIESEVVALLKLGFTNRAIASELHQPVSRVRQTMRRIMRNLGASNRTEVALRFSSRDEPYSSA